MEKEDVLEDRLREGLMVVFCGTAAGDRSAQRRAYYAGPGNHFWPTLHEVGFTPRRLKPEESSLLNCHGIGVTDLAKKTSGPDSVHCKNDFDPVGLRARICKFSPLFVAFNGKKAASIVLGKKTREIAFGLQKEKLGESRIFVLPSTSGAARRYWNKAYWEELKKATELYEKTLAV